VNAQEVGVVLATNRAGDFLEEAIASLAAQTVAVQLVVVDDGSPDPKAVARAAAQVPGARVIRQDPAGVGVARNRGAAALSTPLIAFLDDDDRWHPERAARHATALREHPDAAWSYCGLRTIDASGRVLAEADQVAVTSRLGIARRDTGILLPNLLLRRDAFEAVGGFHSALRLAEDLDLLLRLAGHGRGVFVPGGLVDYRTHGANTSARHHDLARSIDDVLRLHRSAAARRGDDALVAALTEGMRKNDRFVWWGALRAARAMPPAAAARELGWALQRAPGGLLSGGWRRLRGLR
jgi:glycosyltransferase involved in cell wall biosynthesis